jgi:formylmethanofuran dehydrogenase subunit C
MAGGLLKIDGNVGHFLGGASAGLRKGMRGGTVIVKGNAGDRTGDLMRRGLILIEGNVGDYCGSRMIAGTIGVLGRVGKYAGFNMQRGTLLFTQMPQLHATLQDCGMHTLPYLSLLFKSFQQYNTKFSQLKSQRVQRLVGDSACNGNGEILLAEPVKR